jgi:signal transduction histidine kinase
MRFVAAQRGLRAGLALRSRCPARRPRLPSENPVSIRSRLLLLVLSWALPALAAALWGVYLTAHSEREVHLSTLSETSRALALVVDAEMAQRATIARLLAQLPALDRLPALEARDEATFVDQAQAAMRGLDGWVELRLPARASLTTRRGTRVTPAPAADDVPRAPGQPALIDRAQLTPLLRAEDGTLHAAALYPVMRNGRLLGNVAVTALSSELQQVVDRQRLPPSWFAAIVDPQHRIAARSPGGQGFAGRPITPSLRERMQSGREGLVDSTTLEGAPVTGFFSTTGLGWSFIVSMPSQQFGGYLGISVLRVALGGVVLLALAVGGALWVSRSIAEPVLQLQRAAARLQSGEEVQPQSTGIAECDSVSAALARASLHMRSARHELESQVAAAVERTRSAEQAASRAQRIEALGRLTGGVAHDFNNLLGVVSNSARLVQRHVDSVPALRMPVAATLRAVDVGQRLTQHLLRFAGRRPVRPEPVHLDQYLPELGEMLRSVVGQRIEVSVDVSAGTPSITVDSSELELALINLAINARDAMPDGGKLDLSAGPASAAQSADLAPGRYVRIVVADTGSGIDAELGERVFEPFFTTKSVGQGTGLGLSQVHGFCTQAGGTTQLTSAPGAGTRVTLLLPAADQGRGSGAAPSFASTQANVEGLRVLLVEDNQALAEVTHALLTANGCEVVVVNSPQDAVHRLDEAAEPFDIVVSDVVMPGPMDGIALALLLRESHPGVPVVLISGYSSALNSVREFTVLRKPVAEDELLAAMRAAVSGVAVP